MTSVKVIRKHKIHCLEASAKIIQAKRLRSEANDLRDNRMNPQQNDMSKTSVAFLLYSNRSALKSQATGQLNQHLTTLILEELLILALVYGTLRKTSH